MEFGRFINDGKEYEITTPVTPSTWSNYLFNDAYHMETTQTLQGKSSTVKNYNQEAFTLGYRYFYVLNHNTKKAFNPNYVPLRRMPEEYSCVFGLNETRLHSVCDGIACDIKAMVPVSGTAEIWTLQLKNVTDKEQDISLFTVMGLEDAGVMGGYCTFMEEEQILYKYAFPYHVRYEDKAKVEKTPSHYYMFSDIPAASYEMSQRKFWGCDDMGEYPAALKNEKCSNLMGEAEKFLGCLQHRFQIPAGETVEYHIQVGVAGSTEEICALKKCWSEDYLEETIKKSQAYWEDLCSCYQIRTPDENVNHFANYWLKKQITCLTRLNRGGVYCPVRNQLQDALGYSLVQPKEAKKFVYDVLKLQKKDGFIKQWYMTDGSPERALCLIRHTDGPLWLIIAVITMINQNGDKDLFFEEVPYGDGGSGTVYEHLFKAAAYMYEHRGAHGLCLVGDGDWNDPINGMGRNGKGETTWSSLALIYSMNLMLTYMVDDTAPERREELTAMRDDLAEKVDTWCWVEDRYVVGYDDEGVAVGSMQDHDRMFLNTQTWAIMAGVVTEDKMPVVLKNLERLETPFGPVLLDPPFAEWDERWGRISIKKSGTTENGSVYCHASMFKAYSDAVRGDGNATYDTVKRTLPTNPDNPPAVNLQLPLYISNYYYALKGSSNYGRSSCHYGTGTVAWMLMVIVEKLVGVQATTAGLTVEPNLPDEWNEIKCVRKFKDAVYHITIRRGEKQILVNGEAYDSNVLPYEAGKTYQVEVCTGVF